MSRRAVRHTTRPKDAHLYARKSVWNMLQVLTLCRITHKHARVAVSSEALRLAVTLRKASNRPGLPAIILRLYLMYSVSLLAGYGFPSNAVCIARAGCRDDPSPTGESYRHATAKRPHHVTCPCRPPFATRSAHPDSARAPAACCWVSDRRPSLTPLNRLTAHGVCSSRLAVTVNSLASNVSRKVSTSAHSEGWCSSRSCSTSVFMLCSLCFTYQPSKVSHRACPWDLAGR